MQVDNGYHTCIKLCLNYIALILLGYITTTYNDYNDMAREKFIDRMLELPEKKEGYLDPRNSYCPTMEQYARGR
ncbi:hypothetical protein INT48_007307 [Thamnidium elegans]|uniref:Uncharacterized protein n=1 Tax=Thamnidium elegans TaxID=101142 RepID=A0A8H7VXK9_9FUNG|nr:hypothetical protein INT48_007307 [Thamnidium elegans]